MSEVVKFPRKSSHRVSARRPRRSKNGTAEKRTGRAYWRAKRLAWYRDFGRRLRATRSRLGIAEAEAAAAGRFTLRAYRGREAGLPFRGGNDHGLWLFMKKYDVSVNWLLGGEGSVRSRYEKKKSA
jgi:hypothetical protein